MASSSRNVEGREVLNVQLVSNQVKQPIFKAIPNITYKQDPLGALFMIPPKVIMIQDVRKYYNYKIGGIGDMEIREAYKKNVKMVILRNNLKLLKERV